MILSFGDSATSDFYNGVESGRTRRFPHDIRERAIDKLAILNAVADINELRVPPGNHLEKLKGDLKDFWSIRVTGQWRLVFKWLGGPTQVRLVDYHA